LLIAIFLSFTLLFILPYFMASNPVDLMITRLSRTQDVARLMALREQYVALFGLDKPLIE
jgi:ABC-type dipeptide/oligopeptide/nickel transport system permease component